MLTQLPLFKGKQFQWFPQSSDVPVNNIQILYLLFRYAKKISRPFANAVRAGTGAIMCSYNQINNSYSCSNSYTLNYLLKNELNFQGFVYTDYGAHKGGVNTVVAGLDLSLPGDSLTGSGYSYWGPNLTLAVANGTVPEWRLDDMCMRIMSAYYKVGRDKIHIPITFDSFAFTPDGPVPLLDPKAPIEHINDYINVRAQHKDLARELGRSSIVLLKNSGTLPLGKDEARIAIIGEDARPDPGGNNACRDRGCLNGTLAMGWGSGSWLFPYLVSPEEAIKNYVQTFTNGSVTSITNNWADTEIDFLVSQATVALVFVNADSGEAELTVDGNYGDRNNLTLWKSGDDLIQKVSAICNNTVVVIHSVGPVLVSEWYENPNITGLLWAGLPGQESGNSLVDVLYGDYNPSGKLPFTLGAKREDYGNKTVLYEPNNGDGAPQTNISGLNIDYRYFDAYNITPIYEFGFGLSYTSFVYSNLTVKPTGAGPYTPTTGQTKAAPSFSGSNMTSPIGNLSAYIFPSDNPQYSRYIYPYLTTTNATLNSSDPNYGMPGSDYLPHGYNDSGPQPLLPAGGAPGGNPSLWEVIYTVTSTITNTGSLAGYEVAQLYVALGGADEPPKVLRGFDRVWVEAGKSTTFSAPLMRRDVSTWDVAKQDWVMGEGVRIFVGASSRDLPLQVDVKF